MTPTPPSTTSSSAGGHSPDANFRVVRKRNRVPLSCAPCRNRKLKCNRSNPCENCVRRGDASSCSYAAPGTRRKNQSQGATSPDDMQNRIDRLEGLVLSLMTNGAQSAGPAAAAAVISRSQSDSTASSSFLPEVEREDDDMIKEEEEGDDSEVECVTNSLGILKVDADKGKSLYFGDSHWHMVLKDIAEVKNYFANHKKELDKNYERFESSKSEAAKKGPVFLFSTYIAISDAELRAQLPVRSVVDKLVVRYMNSHEPGIHIIHAPTFHKLLQTHWQDPSKTSIVWLGLLYSILSLAMQSYNKIGDEPLEWKGETNDLAAEYRLRTVQCLVNSDYTKSDMYTVETMLLYVSGEFNVRWDCEVGLWVIIGMIVRLSMRMGYHRDPSKYQGLTPYQAEMRRRIWSFVRQIDTMFSFQLALPSMIRTSDCDTALPRNIFEDEFGPDSKVLPPARPLSEATPVLYMITKAEMSFEFGGILEDLNTVVGKPVSYDDILKRDGRLRELKSNMAPHLRYRPLEECTHDPATLLMQRFSLEIFWHKTMCVLHRKYIIRARQNSRFAHSRRACIESSMEILRHQIQLHRESQPGGRLRSMKWLVSSLTKHDFLLAAMIVCLDLNYDAINESRPNAAPQYDSYFWTPIQKDDMFQILEQSQVIWTGAADESMEAYKASQILNIILDKIKVAKATPADTGPTTTAEAFAQFDDDNLRPEHSAAMTLGMLSGGLSPNTAAMFNNIGVGAAASSPGAGRYGSMDMGMGISPGNTTGMTPNYGGLDTSNLFGSPFPAFGNAAVGVGGAGVGMGMGVGTGMIDIPASLDWEAWDSYIQNSNTVDPGFQFYPTVMDAEQPSPEGPVGESDPSASSTTAYNNIFMGANTPGR